MRIYQSETGDYIATDDRGIKERGATKEDAIDAYFLAGGKLDEPVIRDVAPRRQGRLMLPKGTQE